MIAGAGADVVFVADTLARRFSAIHRRLGSILREHGVPLETIPGTLDIWCRDYMPIQAAEGQFVQFRYEPDYLTGKYRRLRADGGIGPTMPRLGTCLRSELVLDGGNVVGWGDRAIATEKVFRENPGLTQEDVTNRLRCELGLSELIVIPREPYDPIGHADGMVAWLDERTVLVNDYSGVGASFRRRVLKALEGRGIGWIEFPYDPQDGGQDGLPSAAGNWMNFVRAGNVLVVPTFGSAGDRRALDMLGDLHPDHAIEPLDCMLLASGGGGPHCATWQATLLG